MRRNISRSIAFALLLVVASATLALADNVIATGGNATIAVGGSVVVPYKLVATSGSGGGASDPVDDCNASASAPVSVSIATDPVAGVSISPNPITFTECGVTQSVTFTGLSEGVYDVSATASGGASGGTFNVNPAKWTLTVESGAGATNTAPTVDAGGPYLGTEGSPVSLDGTVTDPDAGDTVTQTWSYAANSADLGTVCTFGDATAVDTTITCTDDGTFTLTLTANDGHGAVGDTATLTLSNAAPAITSAAFASTSVSCGLNNATVTVAFTDAGLNDTHTASVVWGDNGTTSESLGAVTSPAGLTHSYNSGGPYTATVTITDDDGDYGSSATTNTVSVLYNLSNILQPVNDTRNGQQPSMFKYGSTIPVKVEIKDCNGAHPSTLDVRVFTTKTSADPPPLGTTEAVATNAPDSGNAMRYSDPIYIFNLASKAITTDTNCTVRVDVRLANGQYTWAFLGLKK